MEFGTKYRVYYGCSLGRGVKRLHINGRNTIKTGKVIRLSRSFYVGNILTDVKLFDFYFFDFAGLAVEFNFSVFLIGADAYVVGFAFL